MKPSPTQVGRMFEQAFKECAAPDAETGDVLVRLAELAAAWGASQAQQTTEPELPEAVAWRWMYQDQPDSERCFNAPLPNTSVLAVAESAEFRRTVQAFYTAAQMQSYADAKAREAIARQTSVYENALRTVLNAVNAYLPPDGISAQECLNRVIAAVDPWPVKGGQQ